MGTPGSFAWVSDRLCWTDLNRTEPLRRLVRRPGRRERSRVTIIIPITRLLKPEPVRVQRHPNFPELPVPDLPEIHPSVHRRETLIVFLPVNKTNCVRCLRERP